MITTASLTNMPTFVTGPSLTHFAMRLDSGIARLCCEEMHESLLIIFQSEVMRRRKHHVAMVAVVGRD